MISMAVELTGGRSVEVASIGREGAVGGIVSCGHAPAFSRAEVLVAGPALQRADESAGGRQAALAVHRATCSAAFPIICWRRSCSRSAATPFIRSPSAPRAGCSTRRTAPATGSSSPRRPSPACSASSARRSTRWSRSLQDEGLIATGRGVIRVTDRAGLKRRSCECYERLEEHFGAVIGDERQRRIEPSRRAASATSRRRGTAPRRRSRPGTSNFGSAPASPSPR